MKKSFFVVFLFLVVPVARAQNLEVGNPVSGSLIPDTTHTYTIETLAHNYVYGTVDQISVDVVVTIKDIEGTVVGTFDGPSRGPGSFQFSPKKDGSYVVEVAPFEGAEGDYVILLVANEPKEKKPKKLVDQMMRPFSGRDRPGASIAVLKGGKVIFARGYGMANLTDGIPMTAKTGMSIASVSKQFTAMAILLLQNEGKLTLADDVRKFIPELKDFGTPITLRNMLNHTTGYRDIFNFLPMAGWNFTDAMTREEPIRIIQRQANLQSPPGAEYNYNNTSFMLLATVVERVSGRPFKQFMEDRIFKPLKMNHTTIKTHKGQVIPGSSQGYTFAKEGGYSYVTDFASAYGASGVNSTALDMTKWMLNYRDARVGGREAIEAITTRGILMSGDTTNYALGLVVRKWRGQRLYTHNGGETSHSTYFGYFPDIESGLFISSNNPSFSLAMWSDFAEAFFGQYLEPDETVKKAAEKAAADTLTADTLATDSLAADTHSQPTPEQLKAISGTWKFLAAPLVIEYTVEGDKLFAQATNQPKFAVKPTSDSTFTFVGVAASVTFHYESDGSVERATHHQGPDSPMKKIEAHELSSEELMVYAGRYYDEELETIYTVVLEDGKLMMHNRWNDPFNLKHGQNDEFSGGAWFLSNIKFDRNPDGAVSGFMGSNGRTRNVWFQKME